MKIIGNVPIWNKPTIWFCKIYIIYHYKCRLSVPLCRICKAFSKSRLTLITWQNSLYLILYGTIFWSPFPNFNNMLFYQNLKLWHTAISKQFKVTRHTLVLNVHSTFTFVSITTFGSGYNKKIFKWIFCNILFQKWKT